MLRFDMLPDFETGYPVGSSVVASISLGTLGRVGLGIATGGGSEVVRAGLGKDSVFDPVLDAAGFGVDGKPVRPDATKYFDTASTNAADQLARAHALGDKAGQYLTTTGVREPTQLTADYVTPTRVEAITPGEKLAQAAQVAAPREVAAPHFDNVERVGDVTAAPVAQISGASVGPAQTTAQTTVRSAAQPTEAEALLRRAAMGSVPSKAEALLNAGLDKNAKKQLSLAASAKGSERRGARRAAMLAIGDQGAEVTQQAAALRADEMAKGRSEFAQSQQQTQRLQQDTNSLQAQIDAAAARGDADAVNKLRSQQAELTQRTQEVDASALNTRAESDAARRLAVASTNAGAANARSSEAATLGLHADEGNAGRETTVALDNAGRNTTVDLANAAAMQRRQELQQQTVEANAGRQLTADQLNQETRLRAAQETEQLRQQHDVQEIQRQQQDQQLRQSGQAQALSAAGGAIDTQKGIAADQLKSASGDYAEDNKRRNDQIDSRQQTMLKVASVLSDESAKDDIAPISDKAAMRLTDAYAKAAKTYKYKGDDETTAGVIAQDIQRDPVGKNFVHERPDGLLGVDYHGLTAVALKGLAAKLDAQASRSAKGRRN